MRVVWSDRQLTHAGTRFVRAGEFVASPEAPGRAELILAALASRGHAVCAPPDGGLAPILAVHDAEYVDFLRRAHADWTGLAGDAATAAPNVHPRGPVARRPASPIGCLGWYTGDMACEITASTWDAAYDSAQAAVHAARIVAAHNETTYALCRPPGHHAGRDRAMGFCYLNNACVAAEELRRTFERVAILDVDVHHGNGTQDIFYERGDIFVASIHGDPDYYYPFYWGYADQVGMGDGIGANLNVPFPVGSGDGPFLDALATALDAIRSFAPQALVLSLGVDASIHDPHGKHQVTNDGFRRMAETIASLRVPLAVIQEGGYASAELGRILGDVLDILA